MAETLFCKGRRTLTNELHKEVLIILWAVHGRDVAILGTGMYVPEKTLTNDDLSKIVDTSDEWIQERSGIRERHIASEGELTSDLAYKASLAALEKSGVSPSELDMVIVATNSPDTVFPGVAPKVQGKLNASRAGAFDLQSGCTGCVYALTVAATGISCGLWDKVLVVGAEVLSRIINWQDRNTCVLFGDGAGAVVLGAAHAGQGRFISSDLRSDGTKSDLIIFPGGVVENPASEKTLKEGLHYVHMKGNEVFKFVNQVIPTFLKEFVRAENIQPAEIDWWLFHQANLRIVTSDEALDAEPEKTWINLDCYGKHICGFYFSCPCRLFESGQVKKGHKWC